MNTSQTNDLIVTYTDGTHDHFKFPAQADSFNMANLVEKLLSSAAVSDLRQSRRLVNCEPLKAG
jgi:hypothetical protein